MGSKLIWYYQAAGLGLLYQAQLGHHSFCFPSDKLKNWESPNMKKNLVDNYRVPYQLAIGKIMNGLLSKSSSTMVLPLGQRMGPEAITPLYAGCC
jgi:hypothetical protein